MLAVREFTDAASVLAAAADVRRRLREPRVTIRVAMPAPAAPDPTPVAAAPIIKAKAVMRYRFPVGPRVHMETPWLGAQPTIKDILNEVAERFGVTVDDILSTSRRTKIVFPRQVVMWRSRHETGLSLPDIGRRLGGKDHTTVLHAVKKLDAMQRSGELAECLLKGGA